MSSRLRFVAEVAGGLYIGANAIQMVKAHTGQKPKGLADWKELGPYPNLKIWIFRELRGIRHKHSDYQAFCKACGLGRPPKKIPPPVRNFGIGDLLRDAQPPLQFPVDVVVRGVQHGGANPVQQRFARPAPQPRRPRAEPF